MREISIWQKKFENYLMEHNFSDGSHDISHFQRVWKTAQNILVGNVDKLVILASCYFHDIVSYPKNHPKRSHSSRDAAILSEKILNEFDFPISKIDNVKHCIEAHSFTANIPPETLEAKIVQDADRMEALGAIGLARTFYVGGLMGSKLFDEKDPFAKNRELNDSKFALDHFKVKLLKLPETMQTAKGKSLAKERANILIKFMDDLSQELVL